MQKWCVGSSPTSSTKTQSFMFSARDPRVIDYVHRMVVSHMSWIDWVMYPSKEHYGHSLFWFFVLLFNIILNKKKMNLKSLIVYPIIAIIGIGLIVLAGMYFSYNNQEVSLRKESDAQRGKIEGVYDKMWKILQQNSYSKSITRNCNAKWWYCHCYKCVWNHL